MGDEAEVSALEGPGLYDWSIFAEGSWGDAAIATVRVGFMPHPLFDGCNPERQGAIEVALKNIYHRLLDGCIRDNGELDDEVAAFADGRLHRLAFWSRLRAELENINLTTFRCLEVDDEEWRGGRWSEYTNEIELHWSPNFSPDLPYVILHELIHKSGFHSDLGDFYPADAIEEQAHQVSEACF
jgi:hypothetical protein